MKQKKRMKEGLIPQDPSLLTGGGGDHPHNTSPLSSHNHNTDSNSSSGGPLKSESPIGNSVLHDGNAADMNQRWKNKTEKNIQRIWLLSNFVFFYIYIRIILRNQNKPEIFKLSSKLCILAFFFVHLFTAYTPNCLVRKSREDQKVKKKEKKARNLKQTKPPNKQTFLRYQWLYCVQVVNYVCRYETMKTKKMKLYDENQYIQKKSCCKPHCPCQLMNRKTKHVRKIQQKWNYQ